MADTTPRYSFPFQEAGDPPDGATLGQDLAEAVEASLGTLEDNADARLDDLEADTAILLGRLLDLTASTSNASATSGTTEQVVDQVVFTAVSGKKYLIRWNVSFSGTVTDDRFFLLLRAGATISDTQLKFVTVEVNNQFDAIIETIWTAGASGPQTISGTVRRQSGTGTLTLSGSGTNPRQMTVERMD